MYNYGLLTQSKYLAAQSYNMLEPSQLPIPSTKFLCSLNNICSFRVVPPRWFILVVGLEQLSTIISPAQSQSFRRKEFGKNTEVRTLTAHL